MDSPASLTLPRPVATAFLPSSSRLTRIARPPPAPAESVTTSDLCSSLPNAKRLPRSLRCGTVIHFLFFPGERTKFFGIRSRSASRLVVVEAENEALRRAAAFFDKVKLHINSGLTLPDAFLIESHWLGDDGRMICGLMETAAETGSGTELLNEIAEDYEDELDTAANQIDKLIEPITIIILGTMVGLLIYAIYAPVFSLGDALLTKK